MESEEEGNMDLFIHHGSIWETSDTVINRFNRTVSLSTIYIEQFERQ